MPLHRKHSARRCMRPQHDRTRRRQQAARDRRRPSRLRPLSRKPRRQLARAAPLPRRQLRLVPALRRIRRAPQSHVQMIVVPRPRPHLPQPAPIRPLPVAQITLDRRPHEHPRDARVQRRLVDQLGLMLRPAAGVRPPGGGIDHRGLGDPFSRRRWARGHIQPEPDVHVEPPLMTDVPRGHGPPARLREVPDQHGPQLLPIDLSPERRDETEELRVPVGPPAREIGGLIADPFRGKGHRACDASRAVSPDDPRRPRRRRRQRAPGRRPGMDRRGESDGNHADSGDQGSTERAEHRQGQRV
jgi:hypothetical protein